MLNDKQIEALQKWMTEHHIEDVECIVPDMSGVSRGKAMPPAKFIDGVRSGSLRLPEPILSMTITGDYVFNDHIEITERDIILVPDMDTLCLAPWQSEPTASAICDVYNVDGTPAAAAPRNALKNIMRLYKDKGWEAIAAPEFEFYLIDKESDDDTKLHVPAGASGRRDTGSVAFSIDAVDDFAALFDDVYDYCQAQNVQIDTLIHEDGPAQFEMNVNHGDVLNVADQSFNFKRAVKKAALKHGYNATFMAKPHPWDSGSSMHLHQSVVTVETGQNIFANEDGTDSDLFLSYIGGLQKYLPAVMPFLAPFFNSYRRLAGRMSSPVTTHWGRENRTVGLRVPESNASNRRVENRIAGSDVNPYLAISASLACGYLGMVEGLTPTEAVTGNAYDLKTNLLPIHYLEAVEAMRDCDALRSVFSEALLDTFIEIKESEYSEFLSVLSEWEIDHLTHNV